MTMDPDAETIELFKRWLNIAQQEKLYYIEDCLCIVDRTRCGGHISRTPGEYDRGVPWPPVVF